MRLDVDSNEIALYCCHFKSLGKYGAVEIDASEHWQCS